ncbi:MAG: hypothetical protein ACYTFG_01350 [Planctomycetota bacterium]|jgi:hypothetical protein
MRSNLRASESGIALIMVIVILLALVAIATPFTVSMQLQEKSSRTILYQAQAKLLAESARNYAVARLYRTHETLEKSGRYGSPFNTPDWDTQEEFGVEMDLETQKDILGKLDVNLTDPRGLLWSVDVEDEQAKVNLNSITPWILGNLMGSAILAEPLSEESPEVEVDDASGFYRDDDPGTVDGYILVEREVISYRNIEGNSFMGCERGQLRDLYFSEGKNHKAENLVVDFRAVKAARHQVASSEILDPYRSVSDIKKVSLSEPEGDGLTGLSPSEIDRVQPYLTVHSRRELLGGWTSPARVREVRNQEQSEEPDMLIVTTGRSMSAGTLLKIVRKTSVGGETDDMTEGDEASDLTQEYAVVAWNQPDREGWQIHLDRKLQMIHEEGDTWEVYPLMRHPVNVNTASRTVLKALLTGLKRRNDQGADNPETGEEVKPSVCVTADEADLIVDALEKYKSEDGLTCLTSHYDFREFLEALVDDGKGDLSQTSKDTIIMNARRPNDYRMIVSTAPFCYRSYDTYTLEVTGVVNADSGREMASHRFREIVELSPPRSASLTLESQYDFQRKIWAPQGRKVCTWPEPINIPGTNPSYSRELEQGDVRLQSVRTWGGSRNRIAQFGSGGSAFQVTLSSGGSGYVEHFDRQVIEEGEMTPEGPVLNGAGILFDKSKTRFGPDTARQSRDCKAGSLGLWFKPRWAEGVDRQVFFDMAESPDLNYTNRITLFYDPAEGALVFRMADGTLEPAAAEVRIDASSETLKEDTWYHLEACWKSTRYGEMSLFLDGRPVGRFVHRNEAGLIAVTKLTQELAGGQVNEIFVESTEGFPPAGVLLIGREAIEYSGKGGATFTYTPYPEFDPEAESEGGAGGGEGGGGGESGGGGGSGGTDGISFQEGEGEGGEGGEGEIPTSQDVSHGRGKRDTNTAMHPQGAPVTIFGFATDLDSKIPVGDATLSSALGDDTQTRLLLPWEDAGSGGGGGGGGGEGEGGGGGGEEQPGTDGVFFQAGPPPIILLTAGADEIKVKEGDGEAFPDQGYLLIARVIQSAGSGGGSGGGGGEGESGGGGGTDGIFQDGGGGGASSGEFDIQYEMVYYGEKDEDTFKEVIRAQFGTSAQDFELARVFVLLISIPISDPSDYETDGGRVQVDNEWFFYDTINEEDGQHHLVRSKSDYIEDIFDQGSAEGESVTGEPVEGEEEEEVSFEFEFRASNRTLHGIHDAGAEIVPVFKTKNPICGRFDVVTMITQEGTAVTHRDTAMVNWADLQYVAFTECVTEAFVLAGSRLLKFPSGETAGQLNGDCVVGGSSSGEGISGTIDEVKFTSASRGICRLTAAIDDSATEAEVAAEAITTSVVVLVKEGQQPATIAANITALPDCGVIKLGDEFIGFTDRDGTTLSGLKRGLLGSEPSVHDNGDFVMNLAFVTTSALTDGISDSANAMPLKSVREFPSEGYVMVNNEMIGFHRKSSGKLVIPSENPDSPGLFRGAFGTEPQSHGGGDIAILMPYRYFDGYRERADIPELAYFQTSFAARGAYWDRVTWEQDIPDEMYQKVKVYVRVDGKPDWNAEVTNKPGGLWLFEDPEGANVIGAQGDFVEVRVYFTYESGAFHTDACKSTPKLKNFLVRYAQPLTVLSHKELGR